jgi:hypothetical protein
MAEPTTTGEGGPGLPTRPEGAEHECATDATDDRISVLATTISFGPKATQIRDWTELSWERTKSAIAYLRGHDVVRHMGGGHYHARQRECASCSRPGREMKGRAVSIDPETWRWFCKECWDADVERVEALVR